MQIYTDVLLNFRGIRRCVNTAIEDMLDTRGARN